MPNGTVLIVEDELLIAFDLEDTVTETGVRAAVAHDVPTALAILEDSSVSAAIVDCNVGQASIEPVLEKLASRSIPFIIHSGVTTPEHYRDWKAVEFLPKPAPPEAVRAALKTAYQNRPKGHNLIA